MNIMKMPTLVSFAAVMVLMQLFAGANSGGASLVLDTYQAGLCSCGTVQITGTLASDVAGIYTISSDSKWITIAPDTVSLPAGEGAPVYIYLTPDCTAMPGDYAIRINAKSDTGLSASRGITATVLPCHGVSLDVSPKEGIACLEETAHFSLAITNNGNVGEDFIISTTNGVLEAGKITLERNETKTIGLDIPAQDTKNEATITVISASTYAADTKTAFANGINCYSAGLAVAPEEKTACTKDAVNYSVMLKNTGARNDTFRINSSFGSLSEKDVSLQPGEAKQITLFAESDKAGNYSFDITAVSRHTKAESRGMFSAVQCRGVGISVAPSEQTVCRGFPANYSVNITNTGILDDTYLLAGNAGILGKENISLPKGASGKLTLSVPGDITGEKTLLRVAATSASDPDVGASAGALHRTENCYAINSSLNSSEKNICAGKTAAFGLEIQNTGKLADDYSINASLGSVSEKYISLKPEEKSAITVAIPTGLGDSGEKGIMLAIGSKNANIRQALKLQIKSAKECYGFSIAAKKDTLFTNNSRKALFEIDATNTGTESAEFTASLDGPDWSYISPRQFMLESGKSAAVYVYAAPSFGAKNDSYLMKINISNSMGLSETGYVQLVVGNATATDLSRFRPSIAKEAAKSAGASKPLYIIVLGAVIIAIIIFGPGFFSKKKAAGDDAMPVEPGPKESKASDREDVPEMPEEPDKIEIIELRKKEGAPTEGILKEKAEPKDSEITDKDSAEKKKPAKRKRAANHELQDVLDNVSSA